MTNNVAAQRKPNLPGAIAKLRAAVDRLTKPSARYLNNTFIEVPSLYHQLCQVVRGVRRAGAASIAQSCPPVWVDAEEQLRNINTMVGIWISIGPARLTGVTGDAAQLLPLLAAKTWPVEHTHHVRRLATVISEWCDDIVKLLDEVHARYITAACPACGEATAYHQDSNGENVRTPALRIIADYGAECQSCGYSWAPNQLVELATMIDSFQPAGELA